jgi:iron complex outermembrane receptor protein
MVGEFRQQLGMTFALVGMTCSSALADGYPSEQDYLQEFPVVLSASRLSQPLSEAPNAMTVIDRDMIAALGVRTIPELLKLVPGMYVSYYKGGQPVVSYLGSTDQYARRMQVMIDGRSVYLPPASTVDWADLPIAVNDVERIEVIRGPAAASHGANSTQGVISIITKGASAMDGKTVSFTRGSKGINDVSAHFGKRGENFNYRMTLAYTADNGYDDLASPPNNIPITQFQAPSLLNNSNDSNQARLINFRADYHPTGVDSLDFQFGFNHDIQGVGFNDKSPPATPGGTNGNTFHDLIANAGFLQLDWLHLLDDSSELKLRYSHIQNNQHEAFPVFIGGIFFPDPVVQSVKTGRDEIEVQHTVQASGNNRLVYGAAWRSDRITAQGYAQALSVLSLPPSYSSSSVMNEHRIFAHDEWRITPALLLNTGGMFERDRMGHQNISPRVAMNFHLTAQQTIRAGASVAYRTPALAEEKFRLIQPGALFVVNPTATSPGLLPERMLSREIGYLGEFREWNTSLDLRVFSNLLGDGIYVNKTSATFVNGMSAVYQGVEATIKHSFSTKSDLTVNIAHERARSNGPSLDAAGNTNLNSVDPATDDILTASIPKNSLSLLYSQRLANDFSFSASYYYQGSLQPFDRGRIDYQPIQRRADMRLARNFKLGNAMSGEAALVVQNLFNDKYTEFIASNEFDRRGYFSLTLDW